MTEVFDELFRAVETNCSLTLNSLLSRTKFNSESRYYLLTQRHPVKKLTVLQWAIKLYPKTSIKMIAELLENGAGTELPIEEFTYERRDEITPLWMAVKQNLPSEIIQLLLDFKADVYFKSEFEDDEKSLMFKSHGQEGFSLLHLAIKVKAHEKTIESLIHAGAKFLLNDQSNQMKETPIMRAVKEDNLKLVKLLLKHQARLDLRDSEGLNVYEQAAKSQNVEICLEFDGLFDPSTCNYFLEILFKPVNSMHWTRKNDLTLVVLGDLTESDELLPIEGYWEWQSGAWSIGDGLVYRLRRRTEIRDQFYLKESIEMVVEGRYQLALNHLLSGLQHEPDPQKKSRAAFYFQRLLQRMEKTTPVSGLIESLSLSDLAVSEEEETVESDDSLMYCPVCSHRFDSDKKEAHLKKCLNNPRHEIIGDRYTNLSQTNLVTGECSICYEDLCSASSSAVVVMNCLCRFHQKCIDDWLRRGKTCPFHN